MWPIPGAFRVVLHASSIQMVFFAGILVGSAEPAYAFTYPAGLPKTIDHGRLRTFEYCSNMMRNNLDHKVCTKSYLRNHYRKLRE